MSTEEDRLVSNYHTLAFFWDKFGMTEDTLNKKDARWVMQMLTISNAENKKQIDSMHTSTLMRGRYTRSM